jgi:hypothetical protein
MKRLKRPDLALLRREKRAATDWDKAKKQKAEAKRAIPVDDVDLLRQMNDGEDYRATAWHPINRGMLPG